MGIFNLFKKEKPIREVRKVSLNEINEVILKKKQEIKADETDVVNLIKSRVNSLIIEFESEILAINQINLSEKKVEEKTKLIVGENLDRFLVHLKKLKNNLEDMGNGGIQDLIKNLDLNIHEFKNKSYMNFEKATFLIGKELGDVMKSIKTFYMDLNNIFKENKELIETFNLFGRVEKSVEEITKLEEMKNKMSIHIESFEIAGKKSKNDIENLKKKIEYTKESKEYKDKMVKIMEVKTKNDELKKEIDDLRVMIDFKELSGIHHSIKEHMSIINNYRNNFYTAFENDNGKSLLEIIGKNKINDRINKIIEDQKEISKSSIVIENDEILEIEREITETKNKIIDLNNEKLKAEKKIAYLDEELNNIKCALNKEIISLNIELI
ncbi:hypothetical protein J4466_05595 [Candidatus Pacearchaeota archaeon]|nr:hypothetical protein [Candidatus Pacearchaeota archaeon]